MFTRRDYIDTVGSLDKAIEFEDQCLSISENLKPFFISRVVKSGNPPDSRYWSWLIDQYEKASCQEVDSEDLQEYEKIRQDSENTLRNKA